MKGKLLGILSSICLMQFLYAGQPIPTSCPDVEAINAVGIMGLNYSRFDKEWFIYSESNYGTSYKWNLVFGVGAPFDFEKAKKIALDQMSKLQFIEGPTKYSTGDNYMCIYDVQDPNINNYAVLQTHL
jgi:hypothetical protein